MINRGIVPLQKGPSLGRRMSFCFANAPRLSAAVALRQTNTSLLESSPSDGSFSVYQTCCRNYNLGLLLLNLFKVTL